jgi:hypothetical protein
MAAFLWQISWSVGAEIVIYLTDEAGFSHYLGWDMIGDSAGPGNKAKRILRYSEELR